MPTVRTYQRQITPQRAPLVERQEYRIPQLQTPAPAVPRSTEGVQRLGSTIAQIGEDLYAREMEKQNQTRVLAAKTQIGEALNGLLYDDKAGALNVHGEAAFGLVDSVGKQLNDLLGKTRQRLSNDRQRMEFDAYAAEVSQSTNRTLNEHISKERYRVDGQKLEGFKRNEIQAGLADPDLMRAEEAAVNLRTHYQDYGTRWGIPQETTDAAIASAVSELYKGKIERYLDNSQDIKAREYYTQHQNDILGSGRGQIEAAIHKGTTLGEAQRSSDTISHGGAVGMVDKPTLKEKDIFERPILDNDTGEILPPGSDVSSRRNYSTTSSMSFEDEDGKEVLI